MKKAILYTMVALITISMIACKENKILVTYPESYPQIEQATVNETSIVYGDSITLSVAISNELTPLSTLDVQVVIDKSVILDETYRTKGSDFALDTVYPIPFSAGSDNMQPVKVYLTSINVDGYETDTIINNTIVNRPVIEDLWVVPTVGTSYQLTLTDAENMIYSVDELDYGSDITFRLATKLDKFKKVDWTGLVFGQVGDMIEPIDPTGDPIIHSDPSLVGITGLTFDAYNFIIDYTGKLLEPVNTLDINNDLTLVIMAGKNFMGGNVYFGEGMEVTFTGITDLANSLSPDYFEVTGANTASFVGPTAIYMVYYYIDGNYMYVEPQPEVIYPEALWICGTGFGRPSTPYEVTSSWNWNSPFDYAPCRLISPGVYQVTIYGDNTDGGAGFGTFDFKFFFKRGWWDAEHEIDASTYTLTSPFIGRADTGNTGNVNGGDTTFDGVFKITLNQNDLTITLEKIN